MPLTFCQIWLNEATGGAGVLSRVFSPGLCTVDVAEPNPAAKRSGRILQKSPSEAK